eukprot:Gb_15213 [translate_table: standard]
MYKQKDKMSVWLKQKMRSIAEKKHSCKLNPYSERGLDKLARLISEIKVKRECLVIKTGFPTTVADLVANCHLSWVPTNVPVSPKPQQKKKLWKPKKNSSKKTHLSPPAAAPSSAKHPTFDSPTNCGNHHGEWTNIAQETNAENSSIVHDQEIPGLDPLYTTVFAVMLVVILSLSPILVAKKLILGILALAFFFVRVVFRGKIYYSANPVLSLIKFFQSVTATFILFFIHSDKPCKPQESLLPNLNSKLSEGKSCVTDREFGKEQYLVSALPPNFSPACEKCLAKTEISGISVSPPTKCDKSIENSSVYGGKKPKSKLLRKFVFKRYSSAPNSPNTKNGTVLRMKALSHSARPSPASSPEPSVLCEKEEMCKGQMSYHSDSDLQSEERGVPISQRMKTKALKFQHSKPYSGWLNAEKLKIGTREKKTGSFFSVFLLIVVLLGLMAGRLPALVCALSWCFFAKAMEHGKP